MEQLFNIDFKKISSSSEREALDRKKNFEIFLKTGLPNKKNENWKFSDFNSIINKNFKKITNNIDFKFEKKIELINDFEHNHIVLVNGILKSCDIRFEEREKIKIEKSNSTDFFNHNSSNNLYYLNKALTIGGFNLEVQNETQTRHRRGTCLDRPRPASS